jgi:hypothetical protein
MVRSPIHYIDSKAYNDRGPQRHVCTCAHVPVHALGVWRTATASGVEAISATGMRCARWHGVTAHDQDHGTTRPAWGEAGINGAARPEYVLGSTAQPDEKARPGRPRSQGA